VLLRGFSGARLEIVRRDGRSWVRKWAVDGGNERLNAERRRLGWLASVGAASGLFEVPRVGAGGVDGGRAWYEIEYVPGRSVESVAAADGHASGIDLGIRLARIAGVLRDGARGPDAEGHAAFLRGKLMQTAASLLGRCGAVGLGEAGATFERLTAGLDIDRAAEVASGIGGGCHGDLALDNALIDRSGRIVLIDPLASDSETAYWDAAKVLQSSLACWGGIKSGEVRMVGRSYGVARPGGLAALHRAFLTSVLAQGMDERALAVHLVVTLARVMRYVDGVRLGALLGASIELMYRLEAGGTVLDEPLDSLRGTLEPVLDGGAEIPAGDAGRADNAGACGGAFRRVG